MIKISVFFLYLLELILRALVTKGLIIRFNYFIYYLGDFFETFISNFIFS